MTIWTPLGAKIDHDVGPGLMMHMAYVMQNYTVSTYYNGEFAQNASYTDAEWAALTQDVPMFQVQLGHWLSYVGGKVQTKYHNFGGIMDELRFWSVGLSQDQIRRNMFAPPPPDASGLIFQWSWDRLVPMDLSAKYAGGDGDFSRAPVWVPSPFPGAGGPIAVQSRTGASAQNVSVCALITAVVSATVVASFNTSALSSPVGRFTVFDGMPGPLSTTLIRLESAPLQMLPGTCVPANLTETETEVNCNQGPITGVASYFCATMSFTPAPQGGYAEIPFTVKATLSNLTVLNSSSYLSVNVVQNHIPTAGAAQAVRINAGTYVSLGEINASDTFSWSFWFLPDYIADSASSLTSAATTSTCSNIITADGDWRSTVSRSTVTLQCQLMLLVMVTGRLRQTVT